MPDAITVLREDHRRVEKLFKELERLRKKGAPAGEKRTVVAEVVRELSVHAAVEEQVFYPAVRAQVEDATDTVLEALEEHHVVKRTLAELAGMNGDEERFDAKVTVLVETVRHHVEEEEGELFPMVRDALGRKALVELCERIERARASAPGEPLPQPPANPPPAQPDGAPGDGDRAGARGRLLGRRRAKAGSKS